MSKLISLFTAPRSPVFAEHGFNSKSFGESELLVSVSKHAPPAWRPSKPAEVCHGSSSSAPAAPVTNTILPAPGTVKLAWDAPVQNRTDVRLVGYYMYHSSSQNGSPRDDNNPNRTVIPILLGTAREVTISNLPSGSEACFAIKAVYTATADGSYDRRRPDGALETVTFRRGDTLLSDYNPNEHVCKVL